MTLTKINIKSNNFETGLLKIYPHTKYGMVYQVVFVAYNVLVTPNKKNFLKL